MSEINLSRGATSSRKLNLVVSEISHLPTSFQVVFTVKKNLDTDLTDKKAIIQKSFNFPTDFTEVESGKYETDLFLSANDTTVPAGRYYWNVRFIDNSNNFIADSVNGIFNVEIRTTQRQAEI